MDKNKKEILIAIILAFLAIIVLGINVINKDTDKIDTKVQLLEDRNRFFEVSNSVNTYIKQVSTKNSENLLKILDPDYINKNNITSDNVLDFVPQIDGNVSFRAKEIYIQQLSDDVYKFYVKGYYSNDVMDYASSDVLFYVICYYYTDNMTFSIEPYDGEMFEGEK